MPYRQRVAGQARLQDSRSRILAAARTLVSEGGWKDAQLANIAATAGLETGTVYRYFSSRAELFAEVLAEVSEREIDVLTAIARSDATAYVRLHTAVATFVKRAMRNPRLAYALIAEPCDKEIDEVRLTYRAAIGEIVRTIISTGQSSGDMRTDVRPDIAASVIVGGFIEGLVGPLSPLSTQQGEEDVNYRREIALLADQIARLACASLVNTGATVHPFARKA